jgi:cell division protein FtsW (lipid II flippase)
MREWIRVDAGDDHLSSVKLAKYWSNFFSLCFCCLMQLFFLLRSVSSESVELDIDTTGATTVLFLQYHRKFWSTAKSTFCLWLLLSCNLYSFGSGSSCSVMIHFLLLFVLVPGSGFSSCLVHGSWFWFHSSGLDTFQFANCFK